MKSIFTLLLSTMFSLSLLAYDGTRLTISSINTNKMFVEVDGRRFTMDENTVTLRDLSTGYHSIRIYTELKKNNGRGIGFGLGKKIRQETIYNNRIFLKNGMWSMKQPVPGVLKSPVSRSKISLPRKTWWIPWPDR